MTGTKLRQAYLDYFQQPPRNHALIPAAPLLPNNDPTTLFTSSGMQPLVPYLKGEPHSMGTRLVDSQPSFRAEDIDEVGDNRHTTFFEMLGNWSLGDYFKKEQLPWVYQFMTEVVGLDSKRLFVTVFAGNEAAPRDDEAIAIWQNIFQSQLPAQDGEAGFKPEVKIYTYESNWWSRAGGPESMPVGEIGGPDSEIFFDFDPQNQFKIHQQSGFKHLCHLNCDCGRFMEIGNSVFMQYLKTENGFKALPKQNVDFGGGLERILAASNNDPDIFKIDLIYPIIQTIETVTGKSYQEIRNKSPMRVIADHMRAATLLIAQGVLPSNKMQGYFLRRLIRRSLVKLRQLSPESNLESISLSVIPIFADSYLAGVSSSEIQSVIQDEQARFSKTLSKGIKIIQTTPAININGKFAFDLYQSYGFPLEITEELVKEQGITVDRADFRAEFKKHQDVSRAGSQGLFKGGLADHSETIVKYHTTTHLLHAALRQILGTHVQQMGSNITAERLRFDFKHPDKLTPEQKTAIETLINQKIVENIPVTKTIEPKEVALQSGAMAFFREKYPDQVSVYTIGNFSKELCGGPHVASTGMIGPVTINKEESVGAGVRRVYLSLAAQR